MERSRITEDDFTEFLAAKPAQVPRDVSEKILSFVGRELNPSALTVFAKLAGIQFLIGSLTLLFCPQFGISLTSSLGIMPLLMNFGEEICMLGCGAFFLGLSLFAVSFILRPEEVRAIKRHEVMNLVSVATLALGVLVIIGGEVELTLGLIWLLGAIVAGAATLEMGWAMRKILFRRAMV